MDYLKTVVPSQLIAERGSSIVVINPGSANVRIGLASQSEPLKVAHCIARHVRGPGNPGFTIRDQVLNSQATPDQDLEREKAYDTIASLLRIPFFDEEAAGDSYPRSRTGRDVYTSQQSRNDTSFTWTNVKEKSSMVSSAVAKSENMGAEEEFSEQSKVPDSREPSYDEYMFKEFICGEEALKISSAEPYCLSRPIRRGHFNVSPSYPLQQVLDDLCAIWDWVLTEKLDIPQSERDMYSAILVVPESLDNREIKEMLSIVLRDLRFTSAVVHQEGLAAAFGNGLSTACVVNIGAQVTSVICIEDGVALPSTVLTLPYGGEDISRSLLWVQSHHQKWPAIHTDPLGKPIDLLMLNKIKESNCQIKQGEVDAVAVVHSYEEGKPKSHKTRLSALNVPPMGLFYPPLFIPEEYPPPPRTWFHDYEDMLEDTWNVEFLRRPDMSDGMYAVNGGQGVWDNSPVYSSKLKKDDNLGLAEAITTSILSTGRIDLQRKLFSSLQLIGGVASTANIDIKVEERVLHAIPSNEAIDTVAVLKSRSSDPSLVPWKGGVILGVLDFGREAWVHREEWIQNGIHIGSGRKYSGSYYTQALAMCYINS